MARRGDYLFRRKGSQNWWIRFQYSGKLRKKFGPKVEKSLGTSDRLEAEVIAQPLIFDHKAALLLHRSASRVGFDATPGPLRYEPGFHRDEEGRTIYATHAEIVTSDEEGKVVKTEQNGPTMSVPLDFSQRELKEVLRYLPKAKDRDEEIIKTWIDHSGVGSHLEAEALNVWQEFRNIVGNKSLAKCSRDDGRKLATVLANKGNSSSTVAKKIGHLRAAVNLAIDEGKLSFNPFRKVVELRDDSIDRRPLSENDMAIVRTNFHDFRPDDQLLWIILATTGMRLDEPFTIREEFEENGIRYVEVGTKTDTSLRRIPIPSIAIPLLPGFIDKPIFKSESEVAGKRLRYRLRRLNISYDRDRKTGDKRKVIHSLRHRAADRLRALDCPQDIRHQLLGHETRTIADSYGSGFPISVLKKWIDKIGY